MTQMITKLKKQLQEAIPRPVSDICKRPDWRIGFVIANDYPKAVKPEKNEIGATLGHDPTRWIN